MYCNGYDLGCRSCPSTVDVQQQLWSGKDALPSLISPKIFLNKTGLLFLKSQAFWLLSRFFPGEKTKQELSSLLWFQGAKLSINYTSHFWLLFSGVGHHPSACSLATSVFRNRPHLLQFLSLGTSYIQSAMVLAVSPSSVALLYS